MPLQRFKDLFYKILAVQILNACFKQTTYIINDHKLPLQMMNKKKHKSVSLNKSAKRG